MDKHPIRNKSKDNPYTLGYDEMKQTYTVEFYDARNQKQIVQISEEVYMAFNKFELEDVSQIHFFQRHIEHSEICEETMEHRMLNKSDSIESIIEKDFIMTELRNAIMLLPEIQRRRIIKYYFEGKSEYDIAEEENTTHQTVHIILSRATRNLEKKLKNLK